MTIYATPREESPAPADHSAIFDQYASLVIDRDAYQSSPTLKAYVDHLAHLAGLTTADLHHTGITVYRDYAIVTVRERTPEGDILYRDGEAATRQVPVTLTGVATTTG